MIRTPNHAGHMQTKKTCARDDWDGSPKSGRIQYTDIKAQSKYIMHNKCKTATNRSCFGSPTMQDTCNKEKHATEMTGNPKSYKKMNFLVPLLVGDFKNILIPLVCVASRKKQHHLGNR